MSKPEGGILDFVLKLIIPTIIFLIWSISVSFGDLYAELIIIFFIINYINLGNNKFYIFGK